MISPKFRRIVLCALSMNFVACGIVDSKETKTTNGETWGFPVVLAYWMQGKLYAVNVQTGA